MKTRKILAAVDDTVMSGLMNGNIERAGIFVPAGAVGTFVLEVDDGEGNWIANKLTDATNTAVDNLVGGVANQYAWANCFGASRVRVRKSAGVANAQAISIGVTGSSLT